MATLALAPHLIEDAKAYHKLTTDKQLADLIDVSVSALSRAKAGKFVPAVAAGIIRAGKVGIDGALRVIEGRDEEAEPQEGAEAA